MTYRQRYEAVRQHMIVCLLIVWLNLCIVIRSIQIGHAVPATCWMGWIELMHAIVYRREARKWKRSIVLDEFLNPDKTDSDD